MIVNKSRYQIVLALALIVVVSSFFLKNTNILLEMNISSCQKETANRQVCYQRLLDETLEKKGLMKAFDALALLYESDPAFATICHGYTHTLGSAAYRLFHAEEKVELTKTSYCGFGFYHGFIEELVVEGGTMDEARAFCSHAGRVLQGTLADAEGACYHGIGHGTVDGTDPQTWGNWEAIIAPGLEMCVRVGETNIHKNRCASGIFNSLAIMYQDSKYRLTINTDDPYRICEKLGPDYFKLPCYQEMNTVALYATQFDFPKALTYLLKIKGETYAISAADSLGVYEAQQRNRDDLTATYKRTIAACQLLPSEMSIACIRGYAAGLVGSATPEREYEEALVFCDGEDLSDTEKESCFERALHHIANFFSKEKMMRICEKNVASEYKRFCEIPIYPV